MADINENNRCVLVLRWASLKKMMMNLVCIQFNEIYLLIDVLYNLHITLLICTYLSYIQCAPVCVWTMCTSLHLHHYKCVMCTSQHGHKFIYNVYQPVCIILCTMCRSPQIYFYNERQFICMYNVQQSSCTQIHIQIVCQPVYIILCTMCTSPHIHKCTVQCAPSYTIIHVCLNQKD